MLDLIVGEFTVSDMATLEFEPLPLTEIRGWR